MSGPVSVASYNLYLGADLSLVLGDRSGQELSTNLDEVTRQLMTTTFPQRAPLVARSLVERQVDLVGLQEVCCWTLDGAEMWDFAELLLAALRDCGEEYEVVSQVSTFAGDGDLPGESASVPIHLRGSNVVLRRVGSRVQVTDEAHGLYEEALGVHSLGNRSVAIARGWCGVRCEVDGRAFAFVDTHTEAYGAGSRDRQRDELLAACDLWDVPLVLVGDFNARPDQVGIPEDLVDAWSVNPRDPGYTCCQAPDLTNEESALGERIDYVWVRGATVHSAELLGADRSVRQAAGLWPSDHAGVLAVIELD